MAKREGQLYSNWYGSNVAWQYYRNNPEYKKQLSQKQAKRNTGGTFTHICILLTIGFIALLAITTLKSIF